MEKLFAKGAELSVYNTLAINLGISDKEGLSDENKKFAIFQIYKPEAWMAGVSKITLFKSTLGMAWEMLYECVDDKEKTVTVNGKQVKELKVNLDKVKNHEFLKNLMRWEGGMFVSVPLRKGDCYCNDANGVRRYLKDGVTPIVRNKITVFTIVETINADGTMNYVKGFDPHTTAARIEDTFFREPEQKNVAGDVYQAPPMQSPIAPQQQTQQPQQQQAPQQAPQQQMPPVQGAPVNNTPF